MDFDEFEKQEEKKEEARQAARFGGGQAGSARGTGGAMNQIEAWEEEYDLYMQYGGAGLRNHPRDFHGF